jgi:hypothetical protein
MIPKEHNRETFMSSLNQKKKFGIKNEACFKFHFFQPEESVLEKLIHVPPKEIQLVWFLVDLKLEGENIRGPVRFSTKSGFNVAEIWVNIKSS